jgi:hypothetical protein
VQLVSVVISSYGKICMNEFLMKKNGHLDLFA